MNLEEFVAKFAEQYYDTPTESFAPQVEFRQFDEWSSLTGLCILSMIKDEFGFFLPPEEFKKCSTIQDVYSKVIQH